MYAANHSTKIKAAPSPLQAGARGGGGRGRQSPSRPFFPLQLGRLLDGAVLVQQLQHLVLVVQHFHHGVSGLCHLVHHQLTPLHVTL